MAYTEIPMTQEEQAPRQTGRYALALVLGLAATAGAYTVSTRAAPVASALNTIEQATSTGSGTPIVHAYVDALCPDCRRHALAIHEYMLSKSDILAAIDLKVDYCMSPFSLDEHGRNLIYVNHYELCAIHTLDQSEWWPMVHCMYGLQNCLNYNTSVQSAEAGQTCAGAESGEDDDLSISGTDVIGDSECDCSLKGVVDYCSAKHTSTDLATLTSCAYSSEGHELAVKSKTIAEAANSGSPLWIQVNNVTISDSANEKKELQTWATSVKSTICNHLELGGADVPSSCYE